MQSTRLLLLLACCLGRAAGRGCQLWSSTMCQYLEGFDVTDVLVVDSMCKGLCTRHRGCDTMVRGPARGVVVIPAAHSAPLPPPVQCKCVAANYEQTCECSIGECAAQRPQMICNQGCPYWEDSCSALVRSRLPNARCAPPVPRARRSCRATRPIHPDHSSCPAARSATAWSSKASAQSQRLCTCRRRSSSPAPMPPCRHPTGVPCCLRRTRSCYEIRCVFVC